MTEAVTHALQDKGLDKSQIKVELFGSPKGPRALRTVHEARKAPGREQCELTVVQDGLTRTLTIEKNKDSVRDSALAQGVELPYSCQGGVCSTCRCKVIQGEGIGRASRMDTWCQNVYISVVAVSLKKKIKHKENVVPQ